MMRGADGHYVGGLVNGARIVDMWGDVGTELMVYVDGDISLFLGYKNIKFTAPVYVGDFMEYHGWIEKVGNQSYTCHFEAWKVATMLDRTDADMTGIAHTAATACVPPVSYTHLAINLRDFIKNTGAKKAVVAGGGFIGLETAENLKAQGLEVTVIDMASQIMTNFEDVYKRQF